MTRSRAGRDGRAARFPRPQRPAPRAGAAPPRTVTHKSEHRASRRLPGRTVALWDRVECATYIITNRPSERDSRSRPVNENSVCEQVPLCCCCIAVLSAVAVGCENCREMSGILSAAPNPHIQAFQQRKAPKPIEPRKANHLPEHVTVSHYPKDLEHTVLLCVQTSARPARSVCVVCTLRMIVSYLAQEAQKHADGEKGGAQHKFVSSPKRDPRPPEERHHNRTREPLRAILLLNRRGDVRVKFTGRCAGRGASAYAVELFVGMADSISHMCRCVV